MRNRSTADESEFPLRLAEYDELRGRVTSVSSAADTPESAQLNDSRWDRNVRLLRQIELIRSSATATPDQAANGAAHEGLVPAGRFGRFEIVRELGQGGGGIVFLARDPELQREVALKIPRLEGLFSAEKRRRFLDEARAAARLRHPNVAAIHDAGTQGAVCWYAAEYCPGIALRDYLQANPNSISIEQAVSLVATIADAVQFAHTQGVIHRDLKPSNVLLTKKSGAPRENEELQWGERSAAESGESNIARSAMTTLEGSTPKLIDFGLAKLVDDPNSATRAEAAIGTPSYMAPEQVDRKYGEMGPAVDVYGLGAILYELVTGVPPFRGDSHAEIFLQLTTREPTRPATLRPGLSADVEAIILKCLEKDPRRRYASVGELADDLRRFLRGEPTSARPLGPVHRLLKWSKRHPAVVVICGIIVAALGIMTVGGAWHIVRLEHELAINKQLRADGLSREQSLMRDQYVVDMQLASRAWNSGRLLPVLDYVEKYVPRRGEFDPRDFAWQHLDHLAHRDTVVLRGHEKTVVDAVFSPDEKRIATTALDGSVRIFDAQSGKQLLVIRGHAGDVRGIVFVNAGRHLLTAGEDGFLKLWSAIDGAEVAAQHANIGTLSCMAAHPDGKRVAVAGAQGAVWLWSTSPLAADRAMQRQDSQINRLAFSRAGNKLVSAGEAGKVRCWNCEQERLDWSVELPLGTIGGLAIHADGEVVAIGGTTDEVALLSMSDGQLIRYRPDVIRKTYGLAFTANPPQLLAVGNLPELIIYDATDPTRPTPQAHLPLHTSGVRNIRVSANERYCLTASADGTVRVWPNTATPGRVSLGRMMDHSPQAIAITGDGRTIVAGCRLPGGQSAARVWNYPSLEQRGDLPDAGPHVAITDDGRLIATNASCTTLKLWNLQQKTCAGEIGVTRAKIKDLAVNSKCKLVAVATDSPVVELFDYRQRKKVAEFATHGGNDLDAVAFSPDGALLAAGDDVARVAIVWEVASGRELARLPCRGAHLSFSNDGKLLSAAGDVDDDSAVLVFDFATWQPSRRMTTELKKPLSGSAFSPDGRLLASISDRGAVHLWDVKTGVEMLRVGADLRELSSVSFFPNGHDLLVSAKHRDGAAELIIFQGGELRFREFHQ